MWQVHCVTSACCQPFCAHLLILQRRASLDQTSDAASGSSASERRGSVSGAAERERRGSSSGGSSSQQLEGSDRIRFLVAALADPTKNAAAAMELQVPGPRAACVCSAAVADAGAAAEYGAGFCESAGHRSLGRAAGTGVDGGRKRHRAGGLAPCAQRRCGRRSC